MHENYMDIGEALEVVWELAKKNKELTEKEQTALNVVEDFIVNHYGMEEE